MREVPTFRDLSGCVRLRASLLHAFWYRRFGPPCAGRCQGRDSSRANGRKAVRGFCRNHDGLHVRGTSSVALDLLVVEDARHGSAFARVLGTAGPTKMPPRAVCAPRGFRADRRSGSSECCCSADGGQRCRRRASRRPRSVRREHLDQRLAAKHELTGDPTSPSPESYCTIRTNAAAGPGEWI